MKGYLRGQLATAASVNIETVRYYEQQGLIPLPARNESGYRVYPNETLAMLHFIKQAKDCGFTLSEIQQIFAFVDNSDQCLENSNELIMNKVNEIDHRINELQKMKRTLQDIEKIVSNGDCSYFANLLEGYVKV